MIKYIIMPESAFLFSKTKDRIPALMLGSIFLVAGCTESVSSSSLGLPMDSPCYVSNNDRNAINLIPIGNFDSGKDSDSSLVLTRDITGSLCALVMPSTIRQYYSPSSRFMAIYEKGTNNKWQKIDAGEFSNYTNPAYIPAGRMAVLAAFSAMPGSDKDQAVGILVTLNNDPSSKLDLAVLDVQSAGEYSQFLANAS